MTDRSPEARLRTLIENFVHVIDDQRWASPNLFYQTVDAYVKYMKALLTEEAAARAKALEEENK